MASKKDSKANADRVRRHAKAHGWVLEKAGTGYVLVESVAREQAWTFDSLDQVREFLGEK